MRFTAPLHYPVQQENKHLVLRCIKTALLNKLADNIIVNENQVVYRGSTGHPTRSFFSHIDKGSFTLVGKGSNYVLINQYTMQTYFIWMAFIGLTAGFIVKWWFGIIAFIVLGSINWTITYFQQQKFTAQLATDINELYKAAGSQG